MQRFLSVISVFLLGLIPSLGFADSDSSIWNTGLVPAASPVKERIHDFNTLLNIIIIAIVVIVAALLAYTLFRYRRNANPVPSKTTHHVKLEIIWTLIPILILLVIVVPSFKLMYFMDKTSKPDLTLKVTGYQWYWGYSYPDQEIEEFALKLLPTEQRDPKGDAKALRADPTYQRLLSTYDEVNGNPAFIVLPIEKNVRVLVTANDVLHAWALPAMGVKKDAVPGRLNETWLRIERPGIYYGQCSEICGIDHGFMPIEIRAVTDEQFGEWVKLMKQDQPKAMAYIQEATVQFAHAQIDAPKLTLSMLWQTLQDSFK